jgi:hypothetical protein
MSVQVADGPFLINSLVGIAGARHMTERVEEWIAQPGSPNLYWALTTLPRPLISQRGGLETEYVILDRMFPELSDADHVRSPDEWQARLTAIWRQYRRLMSIPNEGAAPPPPPPPYDLEKAPEEALPAAKAYLAGRGGYTAEQVGAMSTPQVLVLCIIGQYRVVRDDVFKVAYLPFAEGRWLADADSGKPVKPAVKEILPLSQLMSALEKARLPEARLARQIAGLRVVEAIRLHASGHGGRLPKSLDEVQAVPVPVDPVSGRPFAYRLDGDIAHISSAAGFEMKDGFGYAITIRK